MTVKVTLTAVVVMVTAGSSLAADWPQWRGPNRDGKSADTGLLKQWPENGPPLVWRNDKLGGGYSAPSIASGRVFGMGNRGDEEVMSQLYVRNTLCSISLLPLRAEQMSPPWQPSY